MKNHQQPLNAVPTASSNTNNANFIVKNAVYANVRLPVLNIAVFQSEPALVHETLAKPLNFTSSAILFRVEESRLSVDSEQPITYFQTRSNSNVMDKRPNSEASNLRIPDTSSGRSTGSIPNRILSNCSFQVSSSLIIINIKNSKNCVDLVCTHSIGSFG